MPTTDLQALYDLAEQLLAVDDTTDQTLDVLQRTADRVDALRAAGSRDPGPVRTRVAAQRPAQSQPQPRTSSSPSIVDAVIFATGSWLHLDGGELSLGVFRDSTLVATNDARIFSETFENVAFVGSPRESLRVRMDVCDNGATATALDIAPCITGS